MWCRKTQEISEEGYLIRVHDAAGESMAQVEKLHRQGGRADREVFGGGWLRATRREGGREEEAEGKDKQRSHSSQQRV